MIANPTVLVLGAGASIPFGFPSGRALLHEIIQQLGSPQGELVQALSTLGYHRHVGDFRDMLMYARTPSIDLLLESRTEFIEMGKAAIACALIPCEQKGTLFGSDVSWYDHLLWRLAERGPDEFRTNRLAVVTFNYDRSLEQFLFTTLQKRWKLSDGDCAALMKSVPIVHVYGRLGKLPQITDGQGRSYGGDLTVDAVKQAAAEIQILHEADASSPALSEARGLLTDAKHVCFLGFGYHPTNLERLKVNELTGSRYVIGSAYGLLYGEKLAARKPFGSVSIDLGEDHEQVLPLPKGEADPLVSCQVNLIQGDRAAE